MLKDIGRTIRHLFDQVFRLPQTIANLARLRQQRMVLNELEVERLDRIRHPEKYRGK
jgi:uncharacterized protein YjiS (DUF1127 family)